MERRALNGGTFPHDCEEREDCDGRLRASLHIGTLSHKQIAALAGVAPLARDSGTLDRLKAAGKPTKVALIACARKLLTILNAMMRDQSRWTSNIQYSC